MQKVPVDRADSQPARFRVRRNRQPFRISDGQGRICINNNKLKPDCIRGGEGRHAGLHSALAVPDFQGLFEASPRLYLVLDPALIIVAATEPDLVDHNHMQPNLDLTLRRSHCARLPERHELPRWQGMAGSGSWCSQALDHRFGSC